MDFLSHSDVEADPENEQSQHEQEHDNEGPTTSTGSGKKSNSAAYEMIPLEPGFEPTELDVICARGKDAYNHNGNIRFRALVQGQLHNYQAATSKMAKSHIVREIIESVRRASPKGGFVKKVNGKWYDVGERARREKTGQQIRDLLHDQYRSSTKAKARTRKRMRKSHSENSASKINTQAAIHSAMAGRTGPLPPRIVTQDSENNGAASNPAAARSAMQTNRQVPFRRNSESDLHTAAATYRGRDPDASTYYTSESTEATFDGMRRLRESEASFSNPMNRMMQMNNNMSNMGMNSMNMNMNQSMVMGMGLNANMGMNMGAMNAMNMGIGSQGWGSMTGVNSDAGNMAFMQQTSQNRLPSMLQQQQQQQLQSNSVMSQLNPYAGMQQSQVLGSMTGSHFDNQTHSDVLGMNNMPFQAAAFNNAAAANIMMQGQFNPMQAYVSSNTRPHDPNYNNDIMFQSSGRMVPPMPPNETDSLFHPLEGTFQEQEDPNACQTQQHCEEDDEEPQHSFEEAIDNIYAVDATPKRL